MEVRQGAIPLATLAFVFLGIQVWWLRATLNNSISEKSTTTKRMNENDLIRNKLKYQKEKLEKLLKK